MGQQQRLPGVRMGAVCLILLAVIPCTAPIAALLGPVWYLAHRFDIRSLPGHYRAMAVMGLALAVAQTLLILGLTGLYAWQNN